MAASLALPGVGGLQLKPMTGTVAPAEATFDAAIIARWFQSLRSLEIGVLLMLIIMSALIMLGLCLILRVRKRRSSIYIELRSDTASELIRLSSLTSEWRNFDVVVTGQTSLQLINYKLFGILKFLSLGWQVKKPDTVKVLPTWILIVPWKINAVQTKLAQNCQIDPLIRNNFEEITLRSEEIV
jgi:hypothetical protein